MVNLGLGRGGPLAFPLLHSSLRNRFHPLGMRIFHFCRSEEGYCWNSVLKTVALRTDEGRSKVWSAPKWLGVSRLGFGDLARGWGESSVCLILLLVSLF